MFSIPRKTYWKRDKDCLNSNLAFLLALVAKINEPSESSNPIIT